MRRFFALLAVGVFGLVFVGASVYAQWPMPYGAWGMSGLPFNYYQSQQELPYYAKFPPVYYSYPVPRTYGYSPFAYPPGTMTPEIEPESAPLEIQNPYAPQTPPAPSPASAKSESLTRASTQPRRAASARPQPLVIENPAAIDAIARETSGVMQLTGTQ
jgi:hypothetical protein